MPDDREDDRPWEQPGAVRRDCEPHRGDVLLGLGRISLACGLLSLCLCVPAAISVPLGLVVWLLAERDLAKMAAGQMDPAGRELTQAGNSYAQAGMAVPLLGALGYGWAALLLLSI